MNESANFKKYSTLISKLTHSSFKNLSADDVIVAFIQNKCLVLEVLFLGFCLERSADVDDKKRDKAWTRIEQMISIPDSLLKVIGDYYPTELSSRTLLEPENLAQFISNYSDLLDALALVFECHVSLKTKEEEQKKVQKFII